MITKPEFNEYDFTQKCMEIKEESMKPEYQELLEHNENLFIQKIKEKFPDFCQAFPFTLKSKYVLNLDDDPDDIRSIVKEIQETMNSTEFKELKSKNEKLYIARMEEKYFDFHYSHVTMFKYLIQNEDMSFLEMMLGNLEKIRSKKVQRYKGELTVGTELAEKYLYPVTGRPDNYMLNNLANKFTREQNKKNK